MYVSKNLGTIRRTNQYQRLTNLGMWLNGGYQRKLKMGFNQKYCTGKHVDGLNLGNTDGQK